MFFERNKSGHAFYMYTVEKNTWYKIETVKKSNSESRTSHLKIVKFKKKKTVNRSGSLLRQYS